MDEPTTPPPGPDRELQALLQNRVGRNLLRYQQIELLLKSAFRQFEVLPLPPDAGPTQAPAVELHETTLGGLFSEARRWVTVDDHATEAFWAAFDQVLADRNALVHGFLHAQHERLQTNDGIRAVLAELDAQHARSEPILHLAEGLSAGTVLDAIENGRIPEAERAALKSGMVSALARIGIELVDADPTAAHLAAVVELVRRAEREQEEPALGTYLSTAGDYVRRNFPTLKYPQLGFQNLRSLVSSSGFETWVESVDENGAEVVRYRTVRDRSASRP